MTRQMISHTKTIVMIVVSACVSACASRFRADTAPKSVGMISHPQKRLTQRSFRSPAKAVTSDTLKTAPQPDHFRLRPLGRPTRKYLKATRPSPAENRASHFRQRTLPCCTSQTSIVTILYSASQDGQVKGIGSDLRIV